MQMRAHHQVDFVRPRAGSLQPVEPRRVEHVPMRSLWARLVVAAATVDQDLAAVDLQQPAMDAELEQIAGWIVMVRRKPVAVLLEMRVGPFREQITRAVDRQIGFLNAGNRGFADLEYRHHMYRLSYSRFRKPFYLQRCQCMMAGRNHRQSLRAFVRPIAAPDYVHI